MKFLYHFTHLILYNDVYNVGCVSGSLGWYAVDKRRRKVNGPFVTHMTVTALVAGIGDARPPLLLGYGTRLAHINGYFEWAGGWTTYFMCDNVAQLTCDKLVASYVKNQILVSFKWSVTTQVSVSAVTVPFFKPGEVLPFCYDS